MSELPKGWLKTDIASVTLPYETADPSRFPTDNFVYIDIGSIDNKTQVITSPKVILGGNAPSRARRVVAVGDVLFSTVRTYLKNIAIVPEELHGQFTSTGIAVLRPNEAVDSRYLFNFVRSNSFVTEISKAQDGTLYPAVRDKDVSNFLMPLAPRPEQQRIVTKIDSLNARTTYARDQLNYVPSLIARYKHRLLVLAFSGHLTTNWRGRSRESSKWPTKSLEEIVTDIVAGKNMKCEERPPRKEENGVVKISAVTWGNFDSREAKTLPSSFVPKENSRICEGDFLISRANTLELVGAVVIVENAPTNLFLSDKILRLEMPDIVKPWLMWFLRSPQGRAAIEARASGNQQSMRNLSQRNLLEIEIPWPSQEERMEIIGRIMTDFEWLDHISSEHKAAAQLLPKLDDAILTKAFSGKLVCQNPNDETASALLQRIKAEWVAKPKINRERKKLKKSIEEKSMALDKSLEQVLIEAGDWLTAQTAFLRCGISDGSSTDEVERVYAQLRDLESAGKLQIEAIADSQGRKSYDRIRLKEG